VLLNDLKFGFFEDTIKKYKPIRFPLLDDFLSLVEKPDTLGFKELFIEQLHTDTNYVFLARHIFNYCSTNILDTSSYVIPTLKEDSIRSIALSTKALQTKGYLNDSTGFEEALKKFQVDNCLTPDAKLGKHTVEALNESTLSKVYRMALSLDKIRRSESYPKKYLIINIPEYTLRYYAVDSLKSIHRIIVGTRENQTPELKSRLHTIMVYPFWNVPYSIASKEILPAVQRNVNYLKKNNYRIYKGDREIDPFTVNWKKRKRNSFPYKVIQDPGPSNSLGIIKFEVHNKYSVYFHDTPTKNLFRTNVRSYSHGCMRTESPVDLAKMILAYDSVGRKANPITGDSLDSLLLLAQNYPIRLKAPVPVHVVYRSVTADRERLFVYLDIYKRDEEYVQIMSRKQN
jgi:murein L,D-transpeptidase YcbB/YkuD